MQILLFSTFKDQTKKPTGLSSYTKMANKMWSNRILLHLTSWNPLFESSLGTTANAIVWLQDSIHKVNENRTKDNEV